MSVDLPFLLAAAPLLAALVFYLAAYALELDTPAVYSFDKDFNRIPGLRRIEP